MISFKQSVLVARALAKKYGGVIWEKGLEYGEKFCAKVMSLPWDKIVTPVVSGGAGAAIGSHITGKKKDAEHAEKEKIVIEALRKEDARIEKLENTDEQSQHDILDDELALAEEHREKTNADIIQ